MTMPKRSVTSYIKVVDGAAKVVSVKTKGEIPKEKIESCMDVIRKASCRAPVKVGDVLLTDVAGTGIDVVATCDVI